MDIRITLQQAFDLFILDRTATCAEKTVKYYRENLQTFMNYIETQLERKASEIYFDEINIILLNQYTLFLRTKTKFLGHPFFESIEQQDNKDNRLSNNSIRTYQRSVKVFFNYIYDCNYVDSSAASRYRYVKAAKKEKLPLDASEVKRIDDLFNASCVTGLRNLCIIHLMLDAGLRLGEVKRLKIKDVLIDKGLLFIEDSKGNKSRYVPVGSKLKAYLYKYMVLYRNVSVNQSGVLDINKYKQDYLFLHIRNNEPITDNVIKQMFQKLKKRADIPRLHPHLCRHTFATSYILQGGDLESLRIYMGHEDIATTQKYLHLANSCMYLNNDIYKIDKIFFKRL